MKKLLVITGPTATGKTALGIKLTEKFAGEIISTDSRQVYKFMDIGTGKDTEHFQWGLDLVDPDKQFNVSDYVIYANKIIKEIWERNKLPIVVGGTGQYIKELLYPSKTLHVPPNEGLRNKLLSYSVIELQEELKKVNKDKWGMMNESDRNNPRRLVRAIEVAGIRDSGHGQNDNWDVLVIGLTAPYAVLYKRIDRRVDERLAKGMAEERIKLAKYKLPNTFGYRNETAQEWKFAEHGYARRQMTYLKKYFPQAHWFDIQDVKYQSKIVGLVKEWYIKP